MTTKKSKSKSGSTPKAPKLRKMSAAEHVAALADACEREFNQGKLANVAAMRAVRDATNALTVVTNLLIQKFGVTYGDLDDQVEQEVRRVFSSREAAIVEARKATEEGREVKRGMGTPSVVDRISTMMAETSKEVAEEYIARVAAETATTEES